MPYANPTTKRSQVLEQLNANLSTIAPPDFSIEVKRVLTYEAHRIVIGGEMPAIVIAPITDTRTRALACSSDEYTMTVSIIGALRVDASASAWKTKIELLAGDIQQVLSNDRQLSGAAVYIETESVDIADAAVSGNRVLAVCDVTATIVYRVGVADVTT